jgi:cytochrome c-type biogenesis protein CcmF
MRVYYKPFVPWMWAGVLIMVFGGVLAALDRRYRRNTNQQSVRTAGEALSGTA